MRVEKSVWFELCNFFQAHFYFLFEKLSGLVQTVFYLTIGLYFSQWNTRIRTNKENETNEYSTL
jgi:hypothetical protein